MFSPWATFMIKYTSLTSVLGDTCGGQPSMRGSEPSAGLCSSGSMRSTGVSGLLPSGSRMDMILSTCARDMEPMSTASPSSMGRTTAKYLVSGWALRISCMSKRRVFHIRQSLNTSIFFMMLKAGASAWSVKVSAGMPPRPRPARFLSKKGNSTWFATKMAVSVALHRGSTAPGSAKTSKTVMAIANARQTAAQKEAAPMMAKRAMKAPYSSSFPGSPAALVRRISLIESGMRNPYVRPSNAPMIIVGATTPVGMDKERDMIVMNHFMARHAIKVPTTPNCGSTHVSVSIIKFLSKRFEINSG
mmetsp:Transcript_93423/g.302457  ORF Transcript_93423/g.302457 Transcript_93423/m.302457 type:complete len:303 (+) Transcript_93423:217-1125(+)